MVAMLAVSPAASMAITRILSVVATLVVLLGITVNLVFTASDPHRCGGLLSGGTWLNHVVEDGSRRPLTNWQPDGCMLHKYTSQDIHDCVEGRHLVFIGDSTTRQVFWGTARQLDEKKANKLRSKAGIHEDYDMEFDGIRMVFQWNPFMEFDPSHNETTSQLELYRQQRLDPKPVADQENAAMIFFGTGPWFAGTYEGANIIGNFSEAYANLTDVVHHTDFPTLASQPITEDDGVGPQLFFAPPIPPYYHKDNKRLKDGGGIKPKEVMPIQTFLFEHEEESGIPLLRAYPALLHEQPAAIVDPKGTGFHVIDSVADIKANIILNARCNAKLDRINGYPYDRTCCTDYGTVPLMQLIVLGLCAVYVVMCMLNEIRTLRATDAARAGFFSLEVGIFATALLACYWADRTQAFAKGSKEFVPAEFVFMCILAIVATVATLARVMPPRPRPGQIETSTELTDTKPLSRDQTDEWKGWMQAIILIYHWTGASRVIGIYIGVRLLVAAYLFQTGFGHAVYFVTKKDFSFKRVASVLLRLNLLSCALPYVMHTEYMFYYFAPLVTFWFLIVYATFAIGSKYNDNTMALMAKLGIAAFICPGLMIWTPLLDWLFAILSLVFRIEWNLHEWQFRLGLDGFIVYIGVLMGVASVQTKVYNKVLAQSKGVVGALGGASIAAYLFGSITMLGEKQSYNHLHPYMSFVPILGFIAVRNINAGARIWYSRSMAWLGRCSLETFTLQFHIYLAADTKGLLLLGLFSGDGSLFWDRWRDLLVVVPVFLWFSWRVAEATNAMVKLLTTTPNLERPALSEGIDLDLENKGDESASGRLPWLRLALVDLRLKVAGMMVAMWLMNLLY